MVLLDSMSNTSDNCSSWRNQEPMCKNIIQTLERDSSTLKKTCAYPGIFVYVERDYHTLNSQQCTLFESPPIKKAIVDFSFSKQHFTESEWKHYCHDFKTFVLNQRRYPHRHTLPYQGQLKRPKNLYHNRYSYHHYHKEKYQMRRDH